MDGWSLSFLVAETEEKKSHGVPICSLKECPIVKLPFTNPISQNVPPSLSLETGDQGFNAQGAI